MIIEEKIAVFLAIIGYTFLYILWSYWELQRILIQNLVVISLILFGVMFYLTREKSSGPIYYEDSETKRG